MSATPDSTLTDPQQIIADLRRKLTEAEAERDDAKAERDEGLRRETETAEVSQVINSSLGDLAPVFDAMLEKAMRLCEATFGVLWTYDGEEFTAAAMRGVTSAFADFARTPLQPRLGTGLARLLGGERLVHITDIKDNEANGRALIDLGGARTTLQVPLRTDDALIGVFTIYRQEVRSFSDKQIALLQNFAAQAVIAIENARLLGELRQRTDDLTARDADNRALIARQMASIEVLKAISASGDDPQPVLNLLSDARTNFVTRMQP